MTKWFEEAQSEYIHKWASDIRKYLLNELEIYSKNKEDNHMKVSYKECTGELIKLERVVFELANSTFDLTTNRVIAHNPPTYKYNLEIWDSSKECKISFTGVSLSDVKFLGGEVSFG